MGIVSGTASGDRGEQDDRRFSFGKSGDAPDQQREKITVDFRMHPAGEVVVSAHESDQIGNLFEVAVQPGDHGRNRVETAN